VGAGRVSCMELGHGVAPGVGILAGHVSGVGMGPGAAQGAESLKEQSSSLAGQLFFY
jgi:hypothetical protein